MSQLTSVCAYICLSSIINVAFSDSCNFLFECSQWTHDKYWTRTRYGQINDNRPKTDHTLGNAVGFYLYLISTAPPDDTIVATLRSKNLTQPHTCLIFWYSMYESNVQILKVFTISGESRTEIWNKTGDLPNVWNEAKVEFSYDGEFQLLIEGTKASAGHMALDDISVTELCLDTSTGTQSTTVAGTSIGDRDSNENQLSYGVYVGIAIGLAAILLIASIVILIIIRKRRQQASHKKSTVLEMELETAKKQEMATTANNRPDGKVNRGHHISRNIHDYPNAEMPDVQFSQVSNTGDKKMCNLSSELQNIPCDHGKADDVYNTTYESSSHVHDDETYDHITSRNMYDTTNLVKKNTIVDPTYDYTAKQETYVETQTLMQNALTDPTYDHAEKRFI